MNIFKDHDSVRITRSVETDFVAGRKDNVIVTAGASGAVIAVFGDPERPEAYQVEFCIAKDTFAVATIEAPFVEAA